MRARAVQFARLAWLERLGPLAALQLPPPSLQLARETRSLRRAAHGFRIPRFLAELFSGNPRLSNFLVKTVFSGMKDKEIEAQHVVSEEECSLPPDLQ